MARISNDWKATELLNLLPATKVLPETSSDFRQGIPLEDTKNILTFYKIQFGTWTGYDQLTLPQGFCCQLGLKKNFVQHGAPQRQNSSFSLSYLPVRKSRQILSINYNKSHLHLFVAHLCMTYLFLSKGELQYSSLFLDIVVLDFNLMR